MGSVRCYRYAIFNEHGLGLMICQIQRANQEAILLDIDHPSPSPELPTQISTPRQSPPYNSHIPTTTRKAQLNSQAWDSPAFLKRSHFSSSNYDPFAEEEFPDNDRRKKTKFGRGSGQWRFAERTPSPDKEPDTSTIGTTSPSELQVHEKAIERGVIPLTQKVLNEARDSEQTAQETTGEEVNKVGAMGPPSPPTTNFEPAESEVCKEIPPVEQAPPAASSPSVYSSFVASESDQESEEQDKEGSQLGNNDASMFSGPASDFGLDGSVFSRAQQTSKTAPDSEYVEEIEEPGDTEQKLETNHGLEISMPAEVNDEEGSHEAGDLPSTIKESAHEFMIIDGSDSEQDAQQIPSSPFSSSDQLDAQPRDDFVSSEDEGSSENEAPHLSIDEAPLEEMKEPTAIMQQRETSHELEVIRFQEMPEQHAGRPTEFMESKQSKVEIIDLGSEDDEGVSGRPISPEAGSQDSLSPKSDLADSPTSNKDSTAILPIGASPLDGQKSAENWASIPPAVGDAQKIVFRPSITDDFSSVKEKTPVPKLPEVKAQSKSTSPEEFPSTVQKTHDDSSSKSDLMTPSTTQQSSFMSQPSFTSLQTAPDEETLSTPRLTQATSVGIVPPDPPSLPASQEPPKLEEIPNAEEKSSIVEERPATPQKAPNLIEKLKAMRKLSSQSPRRTRDTSATSPWFAPKRSSQGLPDNKAESEVESLPEKEQSTQQTAASTGQTPEKQKTLSASFIRSTPPRTTAASSPGYLPPSQPPPPGFRTNLSYFVPLATLPQHFTTTVDVLAIAISSTPVTRATSGPRDYNQTIYITDPSSSKLQPAITRAQIFRSYNQCFPILDPGDAIMLREFRVQSFQRQMTLLSTQSSSWAVFRKGAGVQMRGPPVELGAEERLFARGLWRWWDGLDDEERTTLGEAVSKEEPKKANGTAASKGSRASGRAKKAETGDKADSKIKKQRIEGLGINLPGSQPKMRKTSLKTGSMDLDGATDSDRVVESSEPPKRMLRPRGARGLPQRSESPMKALSTRHGTVFTGGLGEPESD